jgi:cytidyltransferase-like protein
MITIGIIPGRYNPPTKGHVQLIKHALSQNDIAMVVIIQGEKTGTDLIRNPLPYDLKYKILSQAVPQAQIMRYKSADIPKIAYEIVKAVLTYDKKYHFSIYTGPDRVEQYSAQTKPKYVKQVKDDLGDDSYEITFEVRTLGREYSASNAREAIRSGDDEKAKKMLAIEDDDLYEEVKGYVMAGVKKEAVEAKIKNILEKI